jgi:hydrogenase small subunit
MDEDEPPGAQGPAPLTGSYGEMIRRLRSVTARAVDEEPIWRRPGATLTTGYTPPWR